MFEGDSQKLLNFCTWDRVSKPLQWSSLASLHPFIQITLALPESNGHAAQDLPDIAAWYPLVKAFSIGLRFWLLIGLAPL